MARVPAQVMEVRVKALQDILEDVPEGLAVMEIVAALKAKGVALPASEYQAVNTILKNAEKGSVAVKKGKKWLLLDEEVEGEDVAEEAEEQREETPAETDEAASPE